MLIASTKGDKNSVYDVVLMDIQVTYIIHSILTIWLT